MSLMRILTKYVVQFSHLLWYNDNIYSKFSVNVCKIVEIFRVFFLLIADFEIVDRS